MTKSALHRLALCLVIGALAGLLSVPAQATPQQAASPPKTTLTPSQMETFLLKARIVRTRPAGEGVTGSERVTLSDGVLTHDAQVQTIDVAKSEFKAGGYTEFDFRDCYCYNIAAYRLARL